MRSLTSFSSPMSSSNCSGSTVFLLDKFVGPATTNQNPSANRLCNTSYFIKYVKVKHFCVHLHQSWLKSNETKINSDAMQNKICQVLFELFSGSYPSCHMGIAPNNMKFFFIMYLKIWSLSELDNLLLTISTASRPTFSHTLCLIFSAKSCPVGDFL